VVFATYSFVSKRLVICAGIFLCLDWFVGDHSANTKNRDVLEFRKIQRIYEEYIQPNKTSLFSITTKTYENKHHCLSQHATIINLLVHQNKKLDILEVECSVLQNLTLNLHKDTLSSPSNIKDSTHYVQIDLKKNETLHQLKEVMDIQQQHSHISEANQDKTNILHVFL
jgi:hypothetical protein